MKVIECTLEKEGFKAYYYPGTKEIITELKAIS